MQLSRRCLKSFCLLVIVVTACQATAQTVNLVPVRKSRPTFTRYDDTTTWALRLKNDAVVESPLLRLRDVATPIQSDPPWWDRAGASIIGLMPVDEKEMVVELSRLQQAIAKSTSVPNIEWSGASEVRVTFKRPAAKLTIDSEVVQASVTTDVAPVQRMVLVQPVVNPNLPPMPPSERDRIVRLVQIGIDRYDTRLRESFDIEIDSGQVTIDQLRGFRSIESITWDAPPSEGINVGKVLGMNAREQVTAMVEVSFVARPLVVCANESLRRGQVIAESDLTLMPAPRNVPINDVFTDLGEVVGKQVQTVLQKERPVARSSVGAVTVVERGDLVEVRVIGGGITIATGAKTLAPGAKGDLIAVETLEPRRKLMARVAGPGIVEIITRPPRVR